MSPRPVLNNARPTQAKILRFVQKERRKETERRGRGKNVRDKKRSKYKVLYVLAKLMMPQISNLPC